MLKLHDNNDLLIEMMDFCFENDIEYITDLVGYAKVHREDWYKSLSCEKNYASMTRCLASHSER